MKNSNFMMAVSIAALLAAAPALADSATAEKHETVKQEVKEGWTDTKQAVSNTTTEAKQAVANTTENAREAMSSDIEKASMLPAETGAASAPISLDKRMTAAGMIGKPVYNQKNERVATVEDVILDSEGHANTIVVKDGSFLNLGGKLAAFDYDAIIDRKKDGDLVMPITQKTIDNVAEFSYKPSDKATVRVLPEKSYSVKRLLAGNLLDSSGKKIASIDNLTLRDGRANLVIASVNRFLGMGGDKVALTFSPAQLTRDKDDVNLQLSDADTRKLEAFKGQNK